MTAATADVPAPPIVTALYLRTKALHVEAERTGIIRDLLRGEASREGYIRRWSKDSRVIAAPLPSATSSATD